MTAFFEYRSYRIKDGKRDRWVKLMEEEIIPFNVAKGIVVLGSWCDEKEDDHYIWMRRFDSEEERARLYKVVYEDPHWVNVIKPHIDEMLDRPKIIVTRLVATPHSVIR